MVGLALGELEGLSLGLFVGFLVGLVLGESLGEFEGLSLGLFVGFLVGLALGELLGEFEGLFVGLFVGFFVGLALGEFVGELLGLFVGENSRDPVVAKVVIWATFKTCEKIKILSSIPCIGSPPSEYCEICILGLFGIDKVSVCDPSKVWSL